MEEKQKIFSMDARRRHRENVAIHPAMQGRSRLSWGAIVVGAVAALAMQLMITSLSTALKFGSIFPLKPESIGGDGFWRVGLFAMATNLVSLGIGGYVAGKLGGFANRSIAVLHGFCSWAVVALFAAIIIAPRTNLAQATSDEMEPVMHATHAHDTHSSGVRPIAVERLRVQDVQNRGGQFDFVELVSSTDVGAQLAWVAFCSLFFGALGSMLGGALSVRRAKMVQGLEVGAGWI